MHHDVRPHATVGNVANVTNVGVGEWEAKV